MEGGRSGRGLVMEKGRGAGEGVREWDEEEPDRVGEREADDMRRERVVGRGGRTRVGCSC